MTTDDDAAVLRRALEQLAGLLDDLPADAADRPTPCADWTVRELVAHIVAAPARFARMVRGEEVDWTPAAAVEQPAAEFRTNAEDLLGAWGEHAGPEAPVPVDWQCAELAVHTWDLATALGRSTADLDQEVAERGLALMRGGLTEDNRSPVFGPEQPAPDGADAYQRIAAFAGRTV